MRIPVIAISIWMFISMTVLGVVGYTYVLWSQYWRTATERRQLMFMRSTRLSKDSPLYPNFISVYRASSPTHSSVELSAAAAAAVNHNLTEVPMDKLLSKINTYKSQLMIQLRKSQLVAGNVIFHKKKGDNNHYNVNFKGQRKHIYKAAKDLICDVKKIIKIEMLNKDTQPFKSQGYGNHFPQKSFFEAFGPFNTCAIVSSAGSLHKSKLGREIDSHDAVLRFNSAPTEGYEDDVGSKTNVRVLNSQVVSKPEFDFFRSPLYRNVTLIAWDPSRYHGSLEEWYKNPDFDLFEPYWLHRKLFPNESFFILHPEVEWVAWDFIQSNTAVPVEQNPPSSGLLGILIMMSVCKIVDVYEYVPSMRLTKRCHYFDVHEDMGCTFGDWHPLASEKLLTLTMNSASDVDIFLTGKITIQGIHSVKC